MRLGRSRYPNVELRINAMTLSPVRLPAFGPWQESPWRSVGYLRVGTGPAAHLCKDFLASTPQAHLFRRTPSIAHLVLARTIQNTYPIPCFSEHFHVPVLIVVRRARVDLVLSDHPDSQCFGTR